MRLGFRRFGRVTDQSARRPAAPAADAVAERAEQFFFVHVMKTGGTTLFRHITKNFGREAVFPRREDRAFPGDMGPNSDIAFLLALPPERLRSIGLFTGHFPYVVCEQLSIDLVTVTMLRDPVARVISHLKHTNRELPQFRDRSLEQIYEDPIVFPCFLDNHQTKVFAMTIDDPLRDIMDVVAIDDARLAIAKANLEKVDVIGLTERHAEFLDELQGRFGWRFGAQGAENVSVEAGDVSPAFRRRIERDNRFDIELYAHAQHLLETRRRARSRT